MDTDESFTAIPTLFSASDPGKVIKWVPIESRCTFHLPDKSMLWVLVREHALQIIIEMINTNLCLFLIIILI